MATIKKHLTSDVHKTRMKVHKKSEFIHALKSRHSKTWGTSLLRNYFYRKDYLSYRIFVEFIM